MTNIFTYEHFLTKIKKLIIFANFFKIYRRIFISCVNKFTNDSIRFLIFLSTKFFNQSTNTLESLLIEFTSEPHTRKYD